MSAVFPDKLRWTYLAIYKQKMYINHCDPDDDR